MKRLSVFLALALLLSLMPLASLAGEYPFLLTAGGSFAYCRDEQGTLMVYGDNQFGQLGKGTKNQSKKPAVFKSKNAEIDPAHIRDIYAGCDYSFFLMDDGTIYGVGNNAYNPMLAGFNRSRVLTHVRIPLEDKTIVKMACGFGQVLALNEAGEVWAWGRNSDGQVGNGTTKRITAPQKLPLTGIVDIAAGGKFSLALDKKAKTLAGKLSLPMMPMGRPGRALRPLSTPSRMASSILPETAQSGPTSSRRWGIPVSSQRGLRLVSAASAFSRMVSRTHLALGLCSAAMARR